VKPTNYLQLVWGSENVYGLMAGSATYEGESVNRSQMDVISFLCVSPGSSTVQLHDSLASRCTCICSEAGFSSQNGNRVEECSTKEQHSVVHLLWATGLNIKDIHKEMFPVYSGKYLSCKALTTRLRNSLKDV
jgi:hypothetical protein